MNAHFAITITDDDRDDQEFLIEAITESKIKCDISCASNGRELMDTLLKRNNFQAVAFELPDLIILDLNMPFMDGYEVLQQIRSTENLKHIPVCILTTSRFEYDKIKAIAYGANDFYSKPMSNLDLPKIVKEIFSKHLNLNL